MLTQSDRVTENHFHCIPQTILNNLGEFPNFPLVIFLDANQNIQI